ncbi:MAG: hypothetical protein H7222_03400 [Methylotenera sp.]|nr:hypothetical protein [Oligoflexia bacterium]
MKQSTSRKLAVCLAAALSAISLSGCGKDSTPAPVAPIGAYGANGQLIGGGGCIPIQQQIPFQAQGIYFDSANIQGGRIPSGQQAGSIVVGGPVVAGQYGRSGANGTIAMDIAMQGQGYQSQAGWSYYKGPVNGQGFVQISPLALQELQQMVATGYLQVPGATPTSGYTPNPAYPQPGNPQPGYPQAGSNLCVSSIAINVGHSNQTIFGGVVYLYLNNSNVAYPMQF